MKEIRIATLALSVLLIATPRASAEEIAEALPEDTILYLQTTTLRQIARSIDRSPVFSKTARRRKPGETAIKELFELLADRYGLTWGRSLAMARSVRSMHLALLRYQPLELLLAIDLSRGSGPFLSILLRDFLEKRTDRSGRTYFDLTSDEGLVVQGAFVEDRFLIALGAGVLARTLDALRDGMPRSLATQEPFRLVRNDHRDHDLWAYLQPEGLRRLIGWPEPLDRAFGLSALEGVGLGSSFETDPSKPSMRLRLYLSESDHPLPRLLPQGAPVDSALPLLPAESLLAATTSLTPSDRSWERFRNLVIGLETDLGASESFRQALVEWQRDRRIDLDRAFLDIEGPAALFVTPSLDSSPLGTEELTFVIGRQNGIDPPIGPGIESVDGFLLCGPAAGRRRAIEARQRQAFLGGPWRRFATSHGVALYLDLRTGLDSLFSAPDLARRIDPEWPLLAGTVEGNRVLDIDLNVSIFTLGALITSDAPALLDSRTWQRLWNTIRDILGIPR